MKIKKLLAKIVVWIIGFYVCCKCLPRFFENEYDWIERLEGYVKPKGEK